MDKAIEHLQTAENLIKYSPAEALAHATIAQVYLSLEVITSQLNNEKLYNNLLGSEPHTDELLSNMGRTTEIVNTSLYEPYSGLSGDAEILANQENTYAELYDIDNGELIDTARKRSNGVQNPTAYLKKLAANKYQLNVISVGALKARDE